tara:strand:- start:3599 stop:3811 length:213 start_codon:yes stop_codon:yes gene_type:complete
MTASTQPTLKQLHRLKGWFEHLSTPGPKLVIRKNGVETHQPYPEEGRQTAMKQLLEINEMIANHPNNQEE